MAEPSGRTAASRLRNGKHRGNPMQKLPATTAGGHLRAGHDRAFVVGAICWQHTTLGCARYALLVGPMRMCRG